MDIMSVPTYFLSFTGPGNSLGETQPLSSVCIAFLGFRLDIEYKVLGMQILSELTKVEDVAVKNTQGSPSKLQEPV